MTAIVSLALLSAALFCVLVGVLWVLVLALNDDDAWRAAVVRSTPAGTCR